MNGSHLRVIGHNLVTLAYSIQKLCGYFFLKVAIPLEWILSIFVSYHIFSLYKSCVGITTNRAVNNFKYSDVLPPS